MSKATEDKFLTHYRKLNPAQREAVDTIEGPVMVIAGPGTGKTQVLTLRIANILRYTDTPADAILALTFTNAGVMAMRKRLVELVGSRGYRVPIHTFHSFANEVISKYPEKFPRIIGAMNALPIDQISILEEVITAGELELLRPYGDPFFYLYPVGQEIDRLKRENISPNKLEEIITAEESKIEAIEDLRHSKGQRAGLIKGKYQTLLTQVGKAKELLTIYRAYEAELASRRLYDFGDMLLEVNRALNTDADFRLQLQEEYHYILADEHQDANQSQNSLLELLASFHDNPNLFIVGDEKQAIFQFQGASLDNFNYFQKLFPQAKLITLVNNYRSTQIILDAARSVISRSAELSQVSLVKLQASAVASAQTPIMIRAFTKPEHELLFLVEDLKAKHTAGTPWSELAVLYRDNKDAGPIIDYFERAGIPFVVRSESNILEDLEIQKLLLIFRTIDNYGEDKYLLEFLHLDFLNFEILEIYRLIDDARAKRVSVWELLKASRKRKLKKLYQSLERWTRLAANQTFLDLYGIVLKESGFLDHLLRLPEAREGLNKLHALYDEALKLTRHNHNFRLADFINFINTLIRHHRTIPLRQTYGELGVELLTAHKAKGLEFDYVYVVKAYDGHWGNRRSLQYFRIPTRSGISAYGDKNDDERRLFYVALTRARLGVTISFAKEGEGNKLNLPSQFVEEIDDSLIKQVSSELWEQSLGDKSNIIFSPRVHQGVRILDPNFIADRFREQGLSATGLNAYLLCPLNYLFTNLLRVIQIRNKHMMYGTAIHKALEDFFNRYRGGEALGSQDLLANFSRSLAYQPIGERDFEASLKRGERALVGWYQNYHTTWSKTILNEYKIPGLHLSTNLKLVGKIDKLEFLSDKQIQMADYKSRAPMSRNEIMGKTKSSTGNYYRQLIFYKLLLERFEAGKFEVLNSIIDFIEPNDRGIYKQEIFEIANQEVVELEIKLNEISDEIVSGKFLYKGCNDSDCPGCRLHKMMRR